MVGLLELKKEHKDESILNQLQDLVLLRNSLDRFVQFSICLFFLFMNLV